MYRLRFFLPLAVLVLMAALSPLAAEPVSADGYYWIKAYRNHSNYGVRRDMVVGKSYSEALSEGGNQYIFTAIDVTDGDYVISIIINLDTGSGCWMAGYTWTTPSGSGSDLFGCVNAGDKHVYAIYRDQGDSDTWNVWSDGYAGTVQDSGVYTPDETTAGSFYAENNDVDLTGWNAFYGWSFYRPTGQFSGWTPAEYGSFICSQGPDPQYAVRNTNYNSNFHNFYKFYGPYDDVEFCQSGNPS